MTRSTVCHLALGVMIGAISIPLLNGLHLALAIIATLMGAAP